MEVRHCQRVHTHPSGDGRGDESLLDLRDCVGDSDGDGRGSTLPVGGGKMPSVLERPMITWLTIWHITGEKERKGGRKRGEERVCVLV